MEKKGLQNYNNNNYAPIIIVTLNRMEHLQRCVKSLSQNTHADQTEIYISVDFPPNEKYVEGYHKVKEYLESTSDLDSFLEVHLYYQEKNLGPARNVDFLKNIVRKKHDRYIFTEDDNEFSPNFLDYVNKGLDIFQDNRNVIAINGMKDASWYMNGNNVGASKLFPSYGYGTWFEKEDKLQKRISEILLNPNTWSIKSVIKLYKKNKYIFALYINGLICSDEGLFWENPNKIYVCDSILAMFLYFTDFYCIVPDISKSRNWGNDGSGINMPLNTEIDPMTRWVLDDHVTFDYKDTNVTYYERNDAVADAFLDSIFGNKLVVYAIIEYALFLLLGSSRKRIIALKRIIRKNYKK